MGKKELSHLREFATHIFQGIEIIQVSHLSLAKQTGQECW